MVLVQDLVSDVEHWSAIALTARVPVIGVHLPSGLIPCSNDDDEDGGGDCGGGGGGNENENENDDDDARFAAVVVGATRAALNLHDRVENAEDAAVTTTTKKIIFAALPGTSAARVAFHAAMHFELCGIADACAVVALDGGAFYLTLVPIRPRRRGERRSLRTFPPGASLRPGSLAFNPDTPRRLSTPPDAFQLHPDVRLYGTTPRRAKSRRWICAAPCRATSTARRCASPGSSSSTSR